jgi:hypothetical protein
MAKVLFTCVGNRKGESEQPVEFIVECVQPDIAFLFVSQDGQDRQGKEVSGSDHLARGIMQKYAIQSIHYPIMTNPLNFDKRLRQPLQKRATPGFMWISQRAPSRWPWPCCCAVFSSLTGMSADSLSAIPRRKKLVPEA